MLMFDDNDTVAADEREATLFRDFSNRLQACATSCPGLARHLQGHSLDNINDRQALAGLPILRKNELMAAQQADPPFGGFVNLQALEGTRVFMSPGPVYEPQLAGDDPWQVRRALHAAGIRRGHRVHNAFSYHLTPGGFIIDEGARSLGCVVFPAGVGGTDTQVQAMRQFQAQVYVGTPDYLQTLLDHAVEEGKALTEVRHALVSGGALFPAMRKRYQEQGIHVMQCYATADFGVIAYETATYEDVHAGMVVNENLIVEIVVPGTGTPVTPGDVGELVVTRLDAGYPLLRFATGDLSAQLMQPSPCGRTQMRLKGWLGRADQRAKVRGMFVDPVQLQQLPNSHPELSRWRLLVERENDKDVMTLKATLKQGITTLDSEAKAEIEQALSQSLKVATNLSGVARLVDELPGDGIVVDDQREYESS